MDFIPEDPMGDRDNTHRQHSGEPAFFPPEKIPKRRPQEEWRDDQVIRQDEIDVRSQIVSVHSMMLDGMGSIAVADSSIVKHIFVQRPFPEAERHYYQWKLPRQVQKYCHINTRSKSLPNPRRFFGNPRT